VKAERLTPGAESSSAARPDDLGTHRPGAGDGNLWLAPEQGGTGLSWGYNGGGPTALAILLGLLLDDINA
jgi:hypothetical protein